MLWRTFIVLWVGQYWAAATALSIFLVAVAWPLACAVAVFYVLKFI